MLLPFELSFVAGVMNCAPRLRQAPGDFRSWPNLGAQFITEATPSSHDNRGSLARKIRI